MKEYILRWKRTEGSHMERLESFDSGEVAEFYREMKNKEYPFIDIQAEKFDLHN